MSLFNKTYFEKNQKFLLFLCNNWLLKYWFRWVLRINKDVGFKERIYKLMPNHYTVKNGNEFKSDFRTHNKFSKRLFCAFKYYWYLRHFIDNVIHFVRELLYLPKLQLAYDSLTVYPNPHPETTSVDGLVAWYNAGAEDTWANVHDALAGHLAYPSSSAGASFQMSSGTTTNYFNKLWRIFLLFDTSGLDDSASISDAVLSIYSYSKSNTFAISDFEVCIVASTPASNTDLVVGDYDQLGTTLLSDTLITYTQWSATGAYKDWTLNSTGISAISVTGISKFGARENKYDRLNVMPAWESSKAVAMNGRASEQADTTNDPKLVITYTIPSVAANKIVGVL